MDDLPLRLTDGTAIVVPRTLEAITTYVLLEQERWFEKEANFVPALLEPGSTAIDIGANLGVYSLAMARRMAPDGRVFAYEPARQSCELLERSRDANGLRNLEIVAAALSDRPGNAHLAFGRSSELHRLSAEGPGETVSLTSLDEEDRLRKWDAPDFVKIDAEGAELRIVEGGRDFFARHSPLVMFEVKSGADIDDAISTAFRTAGYGVYRLLAGAPLFVPVEPGETLDRFELNLFAAKPARAAALAREGRLIGRPAGPWTPGEAERAAALDYLRAQDFAAALPFDYAKLDPLYRSALAGYAAWRSETLPNAERYAALLYAFHKMLDLCQIAATGARLSTLARFAWEAGRRTIAVGALSKIRQAIARGQIELSEPFWPANPRFDALAPPGDPKLWFAVLVLEHLERCYAYSSCFTPVAPDVEWLASQPLALPEMARRHVLTRARKGERVSLPPRLLADGPGHVNAGVWRAGLVPNTLGVG